MSDARENYEKELEFIDTIAQNLNEYKYAKCSDLIAEIQRFIMAFFTLTSSQPAISGHATSLLVHINNCIS